MEPGTVSIASDAPLAEGLKRAIDEVARAAVTSAQLVFPVAWRPTVDVVEILVTEMARAPRVTALTLVHPSAAMGFIASSVSLRLPAVTVRSSRTVVAGAAAPATSRSAPVYMRIDETPRGFLRRAIAELRERALRSGVLVFTAGALVESAIADDLVEELLQSGGVRSIGLVHPASSLDAIAASVRLRLPRVRVTAARDLPSAERSILAAAPG